MKLGKINRQSIGISGFTSILSHYEGMPSTLFYAGTLPDKRRPSVAIVGSRKPTAYGIAVTHKLAFELAQQGVIIISGLAYGIDAVAHKAALEAGGTTIAVLANGLHTIYPAVHRGLAEEIVKQGGAILSEQELGVEAHKYHFLGRNRIVSGLADAVIVTEATDRSGTFSTVAHALTQNKEVFAVPGPITSLLSAGPNRLIQEGAQVALSVEDILSSIAPQLRQIQKQLPLGMTPLEEKIIQCIRTGTDSIDGIVQELGEASSNVLQAITMLELSGVVHVNAGHLYL
jgi:DNA processing protein